MTISYLLPLFRNCVIFSCFFSNVLFVMFCVHSSISFDILQQNLVDIKWSLKIQVFYIHIFTTKIIINLARLSWHSVSSQKITIFHYFVILFINALYINCKLNHSMSPFSWVCVSCVNIFFKTTLTLLKY